MKGTDLSVMLIKEIHNVEEKILNNALKTQDITISQAKVLSILLNQSAGQASLKHLEKETQLAQSVTAGIIIRLEQKKYIESFGDSSDKRIKIVRITALGEQKFQESQQVLAELENKALSALTEGEAQQLKALLIKVRNTLITSD